MSKNGNSDDDLQNRLSFILDKVELAEQEKQWLLAYLTQSEGKELKALSYKLFEEALPPSNEMDKAALKRILKAVHKELFE